MALRCVLGNICRSGRRLVENHPRSLLKLSHKIWDDAKYKELLQDRIEYQRVISLPLGYMYRTDKYLPHPQSTANPNVMAFAQFAVEDFNKQKNAQLEFVRVVKAYRQCDCHGDDDEEYYYLTLEANDAEVVKTYQAIVIEDRSRDVPVVQLSMFGLVADNGSRTLLKLVDKPVVYFPIDARDQRPDDGEITRFKKEVEGHLDLITNHDP